VHFDIEHHANLLPWRGAEWAVVRARESVSASLAALEEEIKRGPVALISVTGASNVTGECPPLADLAELAHRHGARLAVDGAQLAPHRPVNLAAAGIDYFACSGHKLYAPYGGGALIGNADWLDAAAPHQPGGGAVLSVTLDAVDWKPSPARHEGGTPNLVGAVALGAAFQALNQIGFDEIREHESALYGELLAGLRRLGIEPLRIWAEHEDRVGVASFNVPGYRADLVAAYLSAEHGIGVRGGKFCAHPLLQRFGLEDGGAVRASIGLGTGSHDVNSLLLALDELITDGPKWKYAASDGYLSPSPDPRPSADEAFAKHTTGL
jgi:selenocysteine lyase/cysteine desulfurase